MNDFLGVQQLVVTPSSRGSALAGRQCMGTLD